MNSGTIRTPYYYYDTTLLRKTLECINQEAGKYSNYHVHYAIKANANPKLLAEIQKAGLGVDCVSGGEIESALKAGFEPGKIVFAGVGKSDWEIELGIDAGIRCFNVESIPELEVINEIASGRNTIAHVCFRVNPDIEAHTHANITTGKSENKFGIAMSDLDNVLTVASAMKGIDVIGLHFHIGSQILKMDDYINLCLRVNELQDRYEKKGISFKIINVGGGLGIDYVNPEVNDMADFGSYFNVHNKYLKQRQGQEIHFELGRSVVGQCGRLITRVLYVKENGSKKFVITDAGFTDLIRPALYQALHKITNLSNSTGEETYDVVGPICESTDVFAHGIKLPVTKRNDILAILSAGAYGESMASSYNCRRLPAGYTSDEFGL